VTSEGQSIATTAQPVPAAPPSAGDVLRHGANVGFGAIGLARRAMGTAFARIQPTERRAKLTPPSTLDLVPGALAGLALVTERRVRSAVVGVASGTASTARVVTRPVVVQRALRPLEDLLWNWNEVARREQARNRAEASAVLPMLVQQVTENVIAQLDFARIIDQIPIEDIVGQMDLEAIVRRIDLAGVIRESTASITGEAVDGMREQGMMLDTFAERVVDRLLFRKRPRTLELRTR
jgi:hypothetical protein